MIHDLDRLLNFIVDRRAEFVCIGTDAGDVIYLNEHGRRLIGAEDRALSITDFLAPEDRAYFREVVLGEVTRRGHWVGDVRLCNAKSGVPIAVALEAVRLPSDDGAQPCIGIMARDVSERVRAEARTRILVDAGAALSTSLEVEHSFKELAQLVVRGFASYCIIDVFAEAAGRKLVRRVATAHVDPTKRPIVDSLIDFVPELDRETAPITKALVEGTSTLMHEVTPEWIAEIAFGPEHAAILESLCLRSWMTVALVARGKILGSLTCGLADEAHYRPGFSHGYDIEDLFFVEELGRRAGTLIENARLYEYQRNIAVTLQAASLPSSLPHIDHLRLAAEYRPGSDEATIGGDWYDAFQLADRRVVLTVGDVLGHGLHAAVTMTKLRQAMQSAAMVDPDPAIMLDVADQTLLLHDPDGYATAIAAVFDARDHSLMLASAGHPAPLIRYDDGIVEELVASGTLLGVRAGVARHVYRIEMPVNGVLVFFTDGLIEATRDIGVGQERLRLALSALDPAHERPARWLVDAVIGATTATDDIAVLCARIAPEWAPEEPAIQATYPVPESADPLEKSEPPVTPALP